MCEASVTINIGGGRLACFSRLFFHDPHLGRMERILRKCLMCYWLEERNSNHFLKPCRYTPTMSLYRTKGLVCRGKGGEGLIVWGETAVEGEQEIKCFALRRRAGTYARSSISFGRWAERWTNSTPSRPRFTGPNLEWGLFKI